jgi:uncharacterized alpha-E superfamily protein
MLGKTAGGLYWMFRFLERSENIARLVEAGSRIALTRSSESDTEWKSIITTASVRTNYAEKYDAFTGPNVVDFLLRDSDNPSSVISVIEKARTNARMVRTALTTEIWESVNENWMTLKALLKRPIKETDLPNVLGTIRQQSALVRGALHGTMLRNDIYDFARLGTFIERADSTARIIDVKYYTLLPSASFVGSSLDSVQWDMILRSVSAHRSFNWLSENEMNAASIAEFLILDNRLPRSLLFCTSHVNDSLNFLAENYGERLKCHELSDQLRKNLKEPDINTIFDIGLHQFISDYLQQNNQLGLQIEQDYRFNS